MISTRLLCDLNRSSTFKSKNSHCSSQDSVGNCCDPLWVNICNLRPSWTTCPCLPTPHSYQRWGARPDGNQNFNDKCKERHKSFQQLSVLRFFARIHTTFSCYFPGLLCYFFASRHAITVFFAFHCENWQKGCMNRHPVSLRGGKHVFMVFHSILIKFQIIASVPSRDGWRHQNGRIFCVCYFLHFWENVQNVKANGQLFGKS